MTKHKAPDKKVRYIGIKQAKKFNILTFKIEKKSTPSRNFEVLFERLSKTLMKLNTKDEWIDGFDLTQIKKKFTVTGVTIMGDPATITLRLDSIRPALKIFMAAYIDSDESINRKIYEITRCQYLIQEFLYSLNVSEPNYYDPNKFYDLVFPNGQKLIVARNNIIFDPVAIDEVQRHYSARQNFLYNMLQFLDVQVAKLRVDELEKELTFTPSVEKQKEKQLVELWVALREAGFLDGLSKIELTKHRRAFLESFNIIDKNYNDIHSNLMAKKGSKGKFLQHLLEVLMQWPKQGSTQGMRGKTS